MQLCENLLFFCAIHGTLLDRRCKADRGGKERKEIDPGEGREESMTVRTLPRQASSGRGHYPQATCCLRQMENEKGSSGRFEDDLKGCGVKADAGALCERHADFPQVDPFGGRGFQAKDLIDDGEDVLAELIGGEAGLADGDVDDAGFVGAEFNFP